MAVPRTGASVGIICFPRLRTFMQETGQAVAQPRENELLRKLLGTWDLDVTVTLPDGSVLRGRGVARCEDVANGAGVHSTLDADIEGFGPYAEHDLWSYDRWGKAVHFYSVTSSGAVHDHVGGWTDDRTLVLRWQGLYEGKPSTEEIRIAWPSPREIRVREVDTSEGQPGPVFDFVLRKRT